MRSDRLTASLAILAMLAACRADGVGGGPTMMAEFIVDAIQKADAVVVGTVGRVEPTSRDGEDVLRLAVTVREAVKGPGAPGTDVVVEVPTAGKETPTIEPRASYLFFLRGASPGPWRLLELTEPVPVSDAQRPAFLDALRQSARLAGQGTVSGDVLKPHLLQMIGSGIEFFVSDAAKALQTIPTWTEPEIDMVLAVLAGDGGRPRPQGNTRDHLAALVIERAAPARAVAFARGEMATDNSEPVYYGLYKRRDGHGDAILWQLLLDRELPVSLAALRITGLLRRTDMLDEFERRHPSMTNSAVQAALERARALTRRD
jgi:hypothetical protein